MESRVLHLDNLLIKSVGRFQQSKCLGSYPPYIGFVFHVFTCPCVIVCVIMVTHVDSLELFHCILSSISSHTEVQLDTLFYTLSSILSWRTNDGMKFACNGIMCLNHEDWYHTIRMWLIYSR